MTSYERWKNANNIFYDRTKRSKNVVLCLCLSGCSTRSVRPDRVINWTLGNFLKPLATIYLPKSPTFLGNFCKSVKIDHFSSEFIFGNFYRHSVIFFWLHWTQLNVCQNSLFHCFSTFSPILFVYDIVSYVSAYVVSL